MMRAQTNNRDAPEFYSGVAWMGLGLNTNEMNTTKGGIL